MTLPIWILEAASTNCETRRHTSSLTGASPMLLRHLSDDPQPLKLPLPDHLSSCRSPILKLANVCLSYLSKMCVDLFLYEWDICYSIFYCNYLSIVLFCESFSIGCSFMVTQFYLYQPLWSSLWPNVIDIDPISCRPDASKYPREAKLHVVSILLDAKLNL